MRFGTKRIKPPKKLYQGKMLKESRKKLTTKTNAPIKTQRRK